VARAGKRLHPTAGVKTRLEDRRLGLRRCAPKVLSVGVFGAKVSVVPPLLVAPPNRSPRQRLYTPSPVKELPKGTGGLRRLLSLDLGDGDPRNTSRGLRL
jgi:hypothetical protein